MDSPRIPNCPTTRRGPRAALRCLIPLPRPSDALLLPRHTRRVGRADGRADGRAEMHPIDGARRGATTKISRNAVGIEACASKMPATPSRCHCRHCRAQNTHGWRWRLLILCLFDSRRVHWLVMALSNAISESAESDRVGTRVAAELAACLIVFEAEFRVSRVEFEALRFALPHRRGGQGKVAERIN